jgi:PAS domain S-box-containing protein
MDGIQFLVEVRTRFGPVPFILFTGRGREEVVIQAINSGADFYLQKGGGPKAQFAELSHKIKQAAARNKEDEALRESQEKYRILVDESSDPIFSFTPEYQYKYVNLAFAEGIEKPVDNIIGKSIWDIFPKEEADKRFTSLSHVFRTGERKIIEGLVPRANGDRFYVTTVAPVKDTGGRVISAICSSKDITEIKRTEASLRESEEQLVLAIEGSGAVFWDWHVQTGKTAFNERWAEIAGYTRAELSPVSIGTSINLCHPDDLQQSDELLKRHFSKLSPMYECEVRIHHKDGHWIWVLDRRKVIKWDSNGLPIRMTGTHQDISERKELEKEMEYYTQELQQFSASLAAAHKKISLLSSITRHDINNQLTVIGGYMDMLECKEHDPALDEYFRTVSIAAQRIAAMIQFTSEDEEIGVTAPVWQDCSTVVDTAAREASLGKVMVKNDLPAGAEVFADPLIVKVFYNLMDNAARYGGKITTIRFSVDEAGDDYLIVSEDGGDGIIAGEKEKTLERGFGKNTGLGLALAREILSITGITIRETVEPGKGARFEMVVPKGEYRLTGTGEK